MNTTKEAQAIFRKTLGPAYSKIVETLEACTYAWREIDERLTSRNPRPLWNVYLFCQPGLTNMAPVLQFAHADEQIKRAETGRMIAPPTDAEAAQVLAEISQKAPLTTAASAAYEMLFRRSCPEIAAEVLKPPALYPYHNNEAEEVISQIKNKIAPYIRPNADREHALKCTAPIPAPALQRLQIKDSPPPAAWFKSRGINYANQPLDEEEKDSPATLTGALLQDLFQMALFK